jgi:hypothetical protein
MKLERERDIPAFKGKGWRKRMVLRNQARERDPWILRLQMLSYCLLVVPALFLSQWVEARFFPNSLLAFSVIYIVLSLPAYMLFYALFIIPRIRRALESDVKPSA